MFYVKIKITTNLLQKTKINCLFYDQSNTSQIPPTMIISGRMGLLITAYLVLTNMSAAAMSFNAPVFTAIDAWFYICKLIVIAALFEFALILREGPRG